MKPIISVVIPVYNAERYIDKTIECLINQTIKNLEIILVNDGSSDNSLKIMEAYSKKNKNIKIINQANGGSSKARNTGLKASTGDYITFIDADDLIENDMCEVLWKNALENKADISIVGIQKIDKSGKKITSESNHNVFCLSQDEALNCYLKNEQFETYSCCGKMFKSEICRDISFIEGKKSNEDRYFLFQAITKSKIIAVQNINKYYYIMHENSQSTSKVNERLFDNVYFADLIHDWIKNNSCEKLNNSKFNLFSTYLWVYRNFYRDKDAIKEHKVRLKDLRKKILKINISNLKIDFEKKLEYYIIKYFNLLYYFIIRLGDVFKNGRKK